MGGGQRAWPGMHFALGSPEHGVSFGWSQGLSLSGNKSQLWGNAPLCHGERRLGGKEQCLVGPSGTPPLPKASRL